MTLAHVHPGSYPQSNQGGQTALELSGELRLSVASMPKPLRINDAPGETSGYPWGWQWNLMRQLIQDGRMAHVSNPEWRVLDVLLAHANDQGQAWPSVETVCKLTGLGRRAVQIALGGLIDQRLTVRVPGGSTGHRTDTYRFDLSFDLALIQQAGREIPRQRSADTSLGAHSHAPRGAPACAIGRTTVRDLAPPIPPYEPKTKFVDDDDAVSPCDEIPQNLFANRQAVDELVTLGFSPRDASKQVRIYGAAAVLVSVEKAQFFQRHKIKVRGQPVLNLRGFVMTDLRSGLGHDPRVLAAKQQAQAESTPAEAPGEPDRAAIAREQDSAMVRFLLASMPADQIEMYRQQALTTFPTFVRRNLAGKPADHPSMAGAVVAQIFAARGITKSKEAKP